MSELGSGKAPRGSRGRPPRSIATASVATFSAAAATGVAVAGCSLVLDFGGSTESVDAGVPDAAALAACERYEPNNTLEQAHSLEPNTYALGLCEGDPADFFAFDLDADSSLRIALSFEFEEGRRNLEFRLHDRDEATVIDTVSSTGGEASLERSPGRGDPLPAGAYAVEVYPDPAVTDPAPEVLYDLTLSY